MIQTEPQSAGKLWALASPTFPPMPFVVPGHSHEQLILLGNLLKKVFDQVLGLSLNTLGESTLIRKENLKALIRVLKF